MKKKDYELIAEAIRESREQMKNGITDNTDYMSEIELDAYNHAIAGIDQTAEILADSLRQENSRFNKEKFLSACK